MNPKLQQAMVAARSGQEKTAQFLLTQVLKDDPDEVQAWFLLSHLVDSDQRQRAYLQKTVSLDPSHEIAMQRLEELDRVELQFPTEPTVEMPDLFGVETDTTMPAELGKGKPIEEAVTQPVIRQSQTVADSRTEQQKALTRSLIGLSVAAVIVFIILMYVIFATL